MRARGDFRSEWRLLAGGRDVETLIFPKAGHDVCGTGVSPVRLYSADPPNP